MRQKWTLDTGVRRLASLLAVASAFVIVPAAAATHTPAPAPAPAQAAVVPTELVADARAKPNEVFKVIVQGRDGVTSNGVAGVVGSQLAATPGNARGTKQRFDTVNGAAAELTGKQLVKLARHHKILAITPDSPVQPTGLPSLANVAVLPPLPSLSSRQLWPHVAGVVPGWLSILNGLLPTPPAIAVVDSGIEQERADFGGRVLTQVELTSLPGNSQGDGRGHGTFVAGIAAGEAPTYAGAAPSAPIVSIDVMDDTGMALTSEVIAAADWIYRHKDEYNIRVANFSLHSTALASVFTDPLDRAVEKLWFSGVVVVTAAGNYGVDGKPSGVPYAPGNDPFVITVGANDINATLSTHDDFAAPWSAYGYTFDGFAKPELTAPGRYLVGPVPAASTLVAERPDNVVAPGYMQLSGTSFSAAAVSGAAAYLLALHPDWTPDQVKGALMLSASATPAALPLSNGVGEIDAARAALVLDPPNPNKALNTFVVPDPKGGPIPVFDAARWRKTALCDPSWNDASWGDASWGDASWGDASWGDASWGDASWGDASWSSASWGSASWGDASWGDASWGDASWGSAAVADNATDDVWSGGGYWLEPRQEAVVDNELRMDVASDPADTPEAVAPDDPTSPRCATAGASP